MDKLLFVLGGTAWINLVNTTYISDKQEIDILDDTSKTFRWLEENSLLRESDALALKTKDLLDSLIGELHTLRHLSMLILSDLEQKGRLSLSTLDQLERFVRKVNVSLTLLPKNETLKLVAEGKTAIDHILYSIIDSITYTLENTSINRIRKCEHQECKLYFVDTSKSGKRRWCSMELCGNRNKAAEYYARKRKK